MPVKPQSVNFMEVVEDLELLCVKEKQFTSMETAKEVREERVADLRKIKRNFGDGKLLLINRGQTHIPNYKGGHAKL